MCKDCNDTGKIQLLTSVVSCDCVNLPFCVSLVDYADAVATVDKTWYDACCSCHLAPPCSFCLRYADAGLDEPEYCDICGQPSPVEEPRLCQCR